MDAWDFLVDRADFSKTRIEAAPGEASELAEGECLLAIERFALTANNITYAAIGDSFGYWKFFPAPAGLGRIPAWGFASVVRSRFPDAPQGLRLYGYWPMSTHLVARLTPTPAGFTDASGHRAELPPTYNNYTPAPPGPLDDYRALLQPLAGTAFLLEDQLAELSGLRRLVLSSASSKTALALAWFARKRGAWKVTGLTSGANAAALRDIGLYDEVVAYDDVPHLTPDGPAAYVDFAGRREVTHGVHARLGAALVSSIIVGLTHRDRSNGEPPPVGPAPALFFAPARLQALSASRGLPALAQALSAALADFAAESPWLKIRHHKGPEALAALYQDVLAGRVRPEDGHIVLP